MRIQIFDQRNKPRFSWLITRIFLLLLLLPAVHPGRTVEGSSADTHEKQVRDFIAAFNTRDLTKMLNLADDRIQWLSIDGAKISVETEGKAALKASMEKYFKDCATCQSSLEWVQAAGSRVMAKETARWTSKSGSKEQSSLSVYEFQGDKIIRVYYFPAERENGSKQ